MPNPHQRIHFSPSCPLSPKLTQGPGGTFESCWAGWDLDNPGIYYQDGINNEEFPVGTRIIASQKYTTMLRNKGFGNMIRAIVITNSYKKALFNTNSIAINNYCMVDLMWEHLREQIEKGAIKPLFT